MVKIPDSEHQRVHVKVRVISAAIFNVLEKTNAAVPTGQQLMICQLAVFGALAVCGSYPPEEREAMESHIDALKRSFIDMGLEPLDLVERMNLFLSSIDSALTGVLGEPTHEPAKSTPNSNLN